MEVTAYERILERCREIQLIKSSSAVLQWDEATYLPPKAVAYRAEQIAYLEGRSHQLFTDPTVGDWLKSCEDQDLAPESDEQINVRRWRRSYDRATKLPVRFVEEFERHCAMARDAWKQARAASDFSAFQPHLEKIVDLTKEKAQRFGYENSPYDALIDDFEPGAKVAFIRPLFAELRTALVDLVQSLPVREKVALPGRYPVTGQQAFNEVIARAFGYDFDSGRIDTTTHPFATSLGPEDHRITTRYDEDLFQVSFYGILHETGHALYEQGLRTDRFSTPLGSAVSLGIHESQSRLWENHVGRTLTFWNRWHEEGKKHLPDLANFSPEQVAAAMQQVAPSFIRVEADEVTYDLHILLRFEIEIALVEGNLAVSDLPEVWNQKVADYFGLKVSQDRLGVLQDIHWSMGAIGYFPTYTLGNLNAAQLMRAAENQIPDLSSALANGTYQPLLAWLREKVHRHGQRFLPDDLMKRATGESTNAQYRIDYLRSKYLGENKPRGTAPNV